MGLCRELRDAQAALAGKQRDLEGAKQRAKEAESRFRELSNQADRHAARSAQASTAAHEHAAKYKELHQDAQLHGSKHEELWKEARGCVRHADSPFHRQGTAVVCSNEGGIQH